MISIQHCSLCNSKIDRERLCKKHWIERQEVVYTDNLNDLGILRWAKDMMPEHFYNAFNSFHEDLVVRYLNLYNPLYTNRHQRQIGAINYREGGKSHILTVAIPLYAGNHNHSKIILPNGKEAVLREELITIASETGSLAEDFIVRIRDELTSNERLKYFYGRRIQNAYDALDGQWTRRAFKYWDLYYLGVGVGMQIRGRIKGRSRPTLEIFDDIYDEDTVLTPDSRKKVKTWFYGKALNSLDSVKGKAILTGTILHSDTVLVECENNDQWKMIKYYPMPIEKFKKLVEEHLHVDYDLNRCRLPFDDIEDEEVRLTKQYEYFTTLQNKEDWELTWPERHGLLYMVTKFKDAVQSRQTELMYQEYFHVTVSDAQKKFKPEYFQKIKEWQLWKEFGLIWFKSELNDQPQNINIEFGIDLAGIGGRDNTAIVPVGALGDGKLVVFPIIFGKMHLRDGMYDDPGGRISKVIIDPSRILSKGVIDETFRLALKYYPTMIKVGQAGEEDLITPQFNQIFLQNNHYIPVVPRPQKSNEGKKHERIFATCQPKYETRMVYHCLPSQQLELELENLTKYPSDDLADACFAAGTMVATKYGQIPIEKLKINQKVLTPVGMCAIKSISKRKAKIINKFGFTVTPNHKFYNRNSFTSIDTIETPLYFSKVNIKELLLWKYKLLKYQILYKNQKVSYSMEWNSGEQGRTNIIYLSNLPIKENLLKDFMFTFGNMLMECQFHSVIMFIIKIIIASITTPVILSLWKLKNIWNIMQRLPMIKIRNFLEDILKRSVQKLLNGIEAKQAVNGIELNTKNTKKTFTYSMNMSILAYSAIKSIKIINQIVNIVLYYVAKRLEQHKLYVSFVEKLKRFAETELLNQEESSIAENHVPQKQDGEIKGENSIVYNLEIEQAGCYYANGILVSNCEVAMWNIRYADKIKYETFTNIVKPRKISRYSPDYQKDIATDDYFMLN